MRGADASDEQIALLWSCFFPENAWFVEDAPLCHALPRAFQSDIQFNDS